MICLMLSQVRLSVTGSRARYFQKLFTSATLRVALMSSNTARTSGDAASYSMGWGMGGVLVLGHCGSAPSPACGGGRGGGSHRFMRVRLPPLRLSPARGGEGASALRVA